MPRFRCCCVLSLTLCFVAGSRAQEPALLSPANDSLAGDSIAGDSIAGDSIDVPPDAEAEVDRLLKLARPQQKERARKLIEEYPNTRLAEILQRLLDEYAAFDQSHAAEAQARAARTAGYRAYWQSRCCPPPVWNPPVGQIFNSADEPVLYEIRYDGIHRTGWMGPFRLRGGTAFTSPHPYLVRYLSGGAMQVQLISPGEAFAFQGTPGTDNFILGYGAAPSTAPPAPALPTLPLDEPAPVP